MTGDAFANTVQIVATLIALAGLAVSFEFSRRGQKLQREASAEAARQAEESNRAAQAAAQRAAASAALTIDDLARIAGALEAIAARRPTGAGFEARAAAAGVSWRLEATGGAGYRLTNTGSTTARDVWVGGAPSLEGPSGIAGHPDLAPGAFVAFRATVLPVTTDSTITVTWAEAPGAERSSWRYPLPGA